MQRRMRDPVCPLGVDTSGGPLPHVGFFPASYFPRWGFLFSLHFAFRDIESSFDSVKSRPRNETSDAQSVLYTHLPGSDLAPHPTERYAYFQLSFWDGVYVAFRISEL
jgi:hypothetical protein